MNLYEEYGDIIEEILSSLSEAELEYLSNLSEDEIREDVAELIARAGRHGQDVGMRLGGYIGGAAGAAAGATVGAMYGAAKGASIGIRSGAAAGTVAGGVIGGAAGVAGSASAHGLKSVASIAKKISNKRKRERGPYITYRGQTVTFKEDCALDSGSIGGLTEGKYKSKEDTTK